MIRFSHELYSFILFFFSFFILIYTIDENNKQFNPIANLAHLLTKVFSPLDITLWFLFIFEIFVGYRVLCGEIFFIWPL